MIKRMPKMILFDVGGTLFKGNNFSLENGFEALRLSAKNPDATTTEYLVKRWNEYVEDVGRPRSKSGLILEISLSAVLKHVTMAAGLGFDISIYEQEEIFDRHNSDRAVIDGIPELLKALKTAGIRTAIISNNMMSGESLALAVKHWIPESDFEFCLTSADILYCKPSKYIFDVALGYAHLKPEDCWYCGDGFVPDVEGASESEITPIFYNKDAESSCEIKEINGLSYLTINHWNALTDIIKQFN